VLLLREEVPGKETPLQSCSGKNTVYFSILFFAAFQKKILHLQKVMTSVLDPEYGDFRSGVRIREDDFFWIQQIFCEIVSGTLFRKKIFISKTLPVPTDILPLFARS
jgi:hypothetical protein